MTVIVSIPWHRRLKWKLRQLAYRILGIPDELEESIGGLNWGVQQNAQRIGMLEALLNTETKLEDDAEEKDNSHPQLFPGMNRAMMYPPNVAEED